MKALLLHALLSHQHLLGFVEEGEGGKDPHPTFVWFTMEQLHHLLNSKVMNMRATACTRWGYLGLIIIKIITFFLATVVALHFTPVSE